MADLVDTALSSRWEMVQADLLVNMTDRAVRVARAGYFPSLAAVSRYDWQAQSDEFALNKNTSSSFTAGLTLSFSIFDGGVTRSQVGRRKAEHRQSVFSQQELRDKIRIEVEQAYDELVQAKKTLDIHTKTIEQAEEGLRIAQLRYEAGEGTLLEVLSAQTALAGARTSQAEARFALRRSMAGLKLATTIDITGE
jgi:outer membrane protein TolC